MEVEFYDPETSANRKRTPETSPNRKSRTEESPAVRSSLRRGKTARPEEVADKPRSNTPGVPEIDPTQRKNTKTPVTARFVLTFRKYNWPEQDQ